MPNPATVREQRLHKTKAQLIDEIDTLERHAAANTEGGTELKRAEEELAEKEAQLRVALENMPGGMRLIDKDLNYVFFNSRYCELYDFPEGLLKIGESIRVGNFYEAQRGDFGPGDPDALTDQSLAELPAQDDASWERTITGGKTLQVHVAQTPGGGYVSIVTDITERKQAEDKLQESRERLRALADNLPEFISMKDPEGRFLFVNKRFEEWACRSRDDVIGKTVFDIYSDDQAKEFDALDQQAIDGREAMSDEVDLAYPDGKTRAVIRTRFPVISSIGEVLGLCTVNRDITENPIDDPRERTQLRPPWRLAAAIAEASRTGACPQNCPIRSDAGEHAGRRVRAGFRHAIRRFQRQISVGERRSTRSDRNR